MKLARRAGSSSARRAGLMSWLSGHLNGVILQTFTKLLVERSTSARRASSSRQLVEPALSCKRGIIRTYEGNALVVHTDGADVLYNKFNVDSSSPPDNPPQHPNSDYSCVVATTGQWGVSRCTEQHRVVCQSDTLIGKLVITVCLH